MISYIGNAIKERLNITPNIVRYINALDIEPKEIIECSNFSIISSNRNSEYKMIVDGSNLVGIFLGNLDSLDLTDIYDKYINGVLPSPLGTYSLKNVENAYNTISIEDCYNKDDSELIAVCSYFELIDKLTVAFLKQIKEDNKEVPRDYYEFICNALKSLDISIQETISMNDEIVLDRYIADFYLGEESYENLINILNGYIYEMYTNSELFDEVQKKLK